jgi:hypothetical protein
MNKLIQPLLLRQESYRLWFEFYKLCCLSTEIRVIKNLEGTNDFYKSWGDVRGVKFDDWWKTHEDLFTEPVVKVLEDINLRQTDDSLIVEIPLNQSTSKLLESLKKVIEVGQKPNYRKKKVRFTKSYQLTKGSEPKLEKIRNILNIYRDVYLTNRKPSIPKTLELTIQYYDNKKRMVLPDSLKLTNHLSNQKNVERNLGRWMKWGETIMLNVSNGEFPGEY